MRSTTPSVSRTRRTCGFTRASRNVTPSASVSWWISVIFADALGVDEVHPLEVEHERAGTGAVLDQAAHPVLERFGGGEEEAAVEAQHRDARGRLVVRVLVEVAEHLGPASRPSSGIGGWVAT